MGGEIVKFNTILKYSRPKSVDEVAFQDEVVTALKNALETQNVPNYDNVIQ